MAKKKKSAKKLAIKKLRFSRLQLAAVIALAIIGGFFVYRTLAANDLPGNQVVAELSHGQVDASSDHLPAPQATPFRLYADGRAFCGQSDGSYTTTKLNQNRVDDFLSKLSGTKVSALLNYQQPESERLSPLAQTLTYRDGGNDNSITVFAADSSKLPAQFAAAVKLINQTCQSITQIYTDDIRVITQPTSSAAGEAIQAAPSAKPTADSKTIQVSGTDGAKALAQQKAHRRIVWRDGNALNESVAYSYLPAPALKDQSKHRGNVAQATAAYSVKFILFDASDTNGKYSLTNESSWANQVKDWYSAQVSGKTFKIGGVVHVRGGHSKAWYLTCHNADQSTCLGPSIFFDNFRSEFPNLMEQNVSVHVTPNFSTLAGSPYNNICGGPCGTWGLTYLDGPSPFGYFDSYTYSSFDISGMAHELGHSFGLTHAATPGTVMNSNGTATWPSITLDASQALWLYANSPYFTFANSNGSNIVGAVGMTVTSTNHGYYIVDRTGAVSARGDAVFRGDLKTKGISPVGVVKGIVGNENGYWIFTDRGAIYTFGSAKNYGSLASKALACPITDMALTSTRAGYWMVGCDGGVFSFGDAQYHGSMGGKPFNGWMMGITGKSTTGYWTTATDGGIFSFNAPFYGSLGGKTLNSPIVGMSGSGGDGYYLYAYDGGVFTFGSAKFYGSLVGKTSSHPVDLRRRTANDGYWMVTEDGRVWAFGNAKVY